jgi:hypothetical protein
MLARLVLALIFAAMITRAPGHAWAQDAKKFPDWSGQWRVIGGDRWDPTKPAGRQQEAPLTPEYLALSRRTSRTRKPAVPGSTPGWRVFPRACRA